MFAFRHLVGNMTCVCPPPDIPTVGEFVPGYEASTWFDDPKINRAARFARIQNAIRIDAAESQAM
jgi:hypothetical protein